VLVLLGGREFWANGIHLGTIEAAAASGGRVMEQYQRDRRRLPGDTLF
jgi:hypothetical protein